MTKYIINICNMHLGFNSEKAGEGLKQIAKRLKEMQENSEVERND